MEEMVQKRKANRERQSARGGRDDGASPEIMSGPITSGDTIAAIFGIRTDQKAESLLQLC